MQGSGHFPLDLESPFVQCRLGGCDGELLKLAIITSDEPQSSGADGGQSVIAGYLVAGTLVGPNVLAWISTQAELFNIAEFGVALLLFAIGLEFSPRRLMSLGSAANAGE